MIDKLRGVYDGADRGGRLLLMIGLLGLPVCCVLTMIISALPVGQPSETAAPTALVERAAESTAEGESVAEAVVDEPTAALPATDTVAATAMDTETPRPTSTPTLPATDTATPRPTRTATPRPTDTATPRPTLTPLPSLTPSPRPTFTPVVLPTATQSVSGEIATVTQVIDGDTIEVNLNGAIWRVRYIGIDTPETGDVCGSEATQANARLVSGQTVRMVKDQSETDRFGRLLRYVYVGGTFVNGALVSGGWARAVDYPPDTSLSGVLHGLAAQGAGIGCALVAAPLPTVPIRGPEPPAVPIGNCDPSYPTVCIPPPPPDLDCGDIPHRRFTVLQPDPHNFDGSDNDGIGCESG